jgi:GH43 family beta-xylosidase
MGYVFSNKSWPKWAYTDIWAPEIHQVNGHHHVYFSARKRSGVDVMFANFCDFCQFSAKKLAFFSNTDDQFFII